MYGTSRKGGFLSQVTRPSVSWSSRSPSEVISPPRTYGFEISAAQLLVTSASANRFAERTEASGYKLPVRAGAPTGFIDSSMTRLYR